MASDRAEFASPNYVDGHTMGLLSRTRDRRGEHAVAPHPFYAEALKHLPDPTVWAVAADAEFRLGGLGDLRGVLHHDGAILRFMTWGGVERFVGSPMEFTWKLADADTLGIMFESQTAWFMNLSSLSHFVPSPPHYATAPADDAMTMLETWMRSWA